MNTLDAIAARLPGYNPQALHIDTALAFLRALAPQPQAAERVPLREAYDRILAQDAISPLNVPPHDNSAMDGYAFAGSALSASADTTLHVVGTALAGQAFRGTGGAVGPGQCVKIMTGAVMPAGLDTVAPQELVRIAADGASVTIPPGLLRVGDNRRLCGEDLRQGQIALAAGSRIDAAALGLLASLGLPEVPVCRRLRVAYFSTGDEILSLGQAPREGAVYDSNRYTLWGMLRRLGVEVQDMGVVRDEPQALRQAFEAAAAWADAIITSGGVSVGDADHTKRVMRELANRDAAPDTAPDAASDTASDTTPGVVFWTIAMRPGRPMAVGRIGSALLLGLPGNPVAVMVTFLALVRPTLLHMMGCTTPPSPLLSARSAQPIRKKPGRTEYQRGTVLRASDGQLEARTTGQQGSGVLSSMVQANALLVLHHAQGHVAVGDPVDVLLLDGLL